MSQVENVFNGLTDEEIKAYSTENITEEYILIDSNRVITVPESLRRIAVQHDHNIETVTFKCVRYWDGHDMSEMTVYINYMLPDNSLGSYLVESKDIRVDESDPEFMYFDWTISSEITKLNGNLAILVTVRECEAADPDNPDDVVISKQWNTELNTSMQISKGLEGPVAVLQQYPDIIEQLLIRMGRIEKPGLSPIVDVTEISNGYRIIVRDIEGDKTFYVSHGTSPKVNVEETKDGHRVIVTDSNGEKSFEVIDGERGSVGAVFQNINPDVEGGTTYTVDTDRKYRIYPNYMPGDKIGAMIDTCSSPNGGHSTNGTVSVAVGSKVYVFNGHDASIGIFNTEPDWAWETTLTVLNNVMTTVYTAAVFNSKIYIFGECYSSNGSYSETAYPILEFNPETKQITPITIRDNLGNGENILTSEGVTTAVADANEKYGKFYITKGTKVISIDLFGTYYPSYHVYNDFELPYPAYSATKFGDRVCFWCDNDNVMNIQSAFCVFRPFDVKSYSISYTDRLKVSLATANGMVYMLGSTDSEGWRTSSVSRYNPLDGSIKDFGCIYDNDRDSYKNSMVMYDEISVVAVNDKIYVLGDTVCIYDPRANVKIDLVCDGGTYSMNFPDPRHNYKTYFDFEFYDKQLDVVDPNHNSAFVTYDVDGEVQTIVVGDYDGGVIFDNHKLVISDADKVLSHNMEASDSDEDNSDILIDINNKLTEHEEKIEEIPSELNALMRRHGFADSINKFNVNDERITDGLWQGNGLSFVEGDNGFKHTHPIYVEAGKTYKWGHNTSAYWGENRRYAKVTPNGDLIACADFNEVIDNNFAILTATETGYISVNVHENTFKTFMFCEVDKYPDEYTPYLNVLKDTYLERFGEQLRSELGNGAITPEMTSFVDKVQSENLLNIKDEGAVDGCYFELSDGRFTAYDDSKSYYVPLRGSGVYSVCVYTGLYGDGATQRICLFDKDKNYVTTIRNGVHGTDDANIISSGLAGYYKHAVFTITDEHIASGACYIGLTLHPVTTVAMVVMGERYPASFIPYENSLKIDGLKITDSSISQNPLWKKMIAFNGDSICASLNGGYGAIIGNNNNMVVQNIAVGGGTITAEQYAGTTARHWISRSIANMSASADYAILEGGVNDASLGVALGSISNGYNATLDDTTFYGAFESMLKQLIIRFAGKKVGYIAVHKMTNNYRSDNAEATSYYWAAKKCCEKWGVPFLDLNVAVPPFADFTTANAELYALRETYTQNADGWHPNEEGYKKYYVPKIEAWLKTL